VRRREEREVGRAEHGDGHEEEGGRSGVIGARGRGGNKYNQEPPLRTSLFSLVDVCTLLQSPGFPSTSRLQCGPLFVRIGVGIVLLIVRYSFVQLLLLPQRQPQPFLTRLLLAPPATVSVS
jgi:hypothetical protein